MTITIHEINGITLNLWNSMLEFDKICYINIYIYKLVFLFLLMRFKIFNLESLEVYILEKIFILIFF